MIGRRLLPPVLLALMGLSLLVGLGLGNKPPAGGLPWNSAPPEVQAVMWPEPRPLDVFELSTLEGESFKVSSLQGQWSFVFFGYLACPDICSSSLHAMRAMSRMLVFPSTPPTTGRQPFGNTWTGSMPASSVWPEPGRNSVPWPAPWR